MVVASGPRNVSWEVGKYAVTVFWDLILLILVVNCFLAFFRAHLALCRPVGLTTNPSDMSCN